MQLLSVKEISGHLKVKESTLYSWVSQSKIPFVKLNGLLRFDTDEIEAWVKENKVSRLETVTNKPVFRVKIVDGGIEDIIKNAIRETK